MKNHSLRASVIFDRDTVPSDGRCVCEAWSYGQRDL